MPRKIIRHAGHLYRQAAVQIPEHLKGYIKTSTTPSGNYDRSKYDWNPSSVPDEVMEVAVVAAQSAYDAYQESEKEYERLGLGRSSPLLDQVYVSPAVEATDRDWYEYTDEYGYKDQAYNKLPEPKVSHVWFISDNYERGGGHLLFKEGDGWYYRRDYSEGPDKPIKRGLAGAIANAELMFHG